MYCIIQLCRLTEHTLLLLTTNGCMKQIESIPVEIFTPHNIVSNSLNKPVSIMQRQRAMSMLMMDTPGSGDS